MVRRLGHGVLSFENDEVAKARGRMITVQEFADLASLSRRQIDRLRVRRPPGFPHEYELAGTGGKFRRCPRFRLVEVQAWLESRAIW